MLVIGLFWSQTNSQRWHLLQTVCVRTSCTIRVGFVYDIGFVWFLIFFVSYFVCFISAGKAVRVVSGVNLFFSSWFDWVSISFFFPTKSRIAAKISMILCLVFVLLCYASLLGFVCVRIEWFHSSIGVRLWFLNNTLLWLAFVKVFILLLAFSVILACFELVR